VQVWERSLEDGAPRHTWERSVARLVRATHTSEDDSEVRVPRPSLESVLTPAALARLDQLGPSFQQAIRVSAFGNDMDIQTFAVMFTMFEVFLLKTPPGLELPAIEVYFTQQELADFTALPEDIRNTVEPSYHGRLVQWFAAIGIYPSAPTMFMPPEDVLSSYAKSVLSLGTFQAQAGGRE